MATDWIVMARDPVFKTDDLGFLCQRCNKRLKLDCPMPAKAFHHISQYFIEMHRDCKPPTQEKP